jgi:hypothetical protein
MAPSPVCEFVNERCSYDCHLFEVGGKQPVVDIHVGVIGPPLVSMKSRMKAKPGTPASSKET